MTKEEAMKIAKDGLHIFDQRYEEEGDEFLCNFCDALTEAEETVDTDDFSQEKFEDLDAELAFSKYLVAQSNSATDGYNEGYFQDPKPLLKVVCVDHDIFGNVDSSWYWFTIDGQDEVKQIIKKYVRGE